MDAKRFPLHNDVLACARVADRLHQMGQRDLANSIIEAMYNVLSHENDITSGDVQTRKQQPTVALVAASS